VSQSKAQWVDGSHSQSTNNRYEQAKSFHPERWSREIRNWTLDEEVWLNPERISKTLIENTQTS
jgi:hypothetical protein